MAKTIIHPVGGLNRTFGFQPQPPWTTADALNVRSLGPLTGRARGGSRPGLVTAISPQMGSDAVAGTISGTPVHDEAADTSAIVATTAVFAPWMVGLSLSCTVSGVSYAITEYTDAVTVTVSGDASAEVDAAFTVAYGTPIRMMASVRPATGNTGAVWLDDFESRPRAYYLDGAKWSILTPETQMPVIYVSGGQKYATASGPWVGDTVSNGAVAAAIGMDTAKPYMVTLSIRNAASSDAKRIGIAVRMNNAAPDYDQDSVVAWLSFNASGAILSLSLHKYVGAAHTQIATRNLGNLGGAAFDFSVGVNANTVTMYVNNISLISETVPAAVGSRVGFMLSRDKDDSAEAIMASEFRVDYSTTETALDPERSYLFGAAGGTPFAENEAGQMAAVGGSVNLAASQFVDGVELSGKVYIADHDTARYEATGLEISDMAGPPDGNGTKIWKSGGGVDFTTKSIDANNDLCSVTAAGTGGAPAVGAYQISAVAATYINLSDVTLANDSNVSIRVGRAPKVWNPSTPALTVWTQTISGGTPVGAMPVGCPLIALFQGAIYLAGADDNPHVWQRSRVLDPHDWDIMATDSGRSVIGTSDQYGQIAQPLTALIAYLDDYLIFGCRRELWVLRGNPGDGAPLLNISQGVGIIWRRAWCHTPTGHLVFLGEDGLYAIAPNAASKPEPISRQTLPRELSGIDTSLYAPMMAWDPERHGVCIWLTPRTQGKSTLSTAPHWFFDWDRKAFWPDQFWGAHEAMSLCQYQVPSLGRTVLLVGQRDGTIGRFSDDVGSDHGAPLNGKVLLGPLRMGNDDEDYGILHDIAAIIGTGSASVTWKLYTGDSDEEAYDNYTAGTYETTGTWTAGRNYLSYPQRRGIAMYLELSSSGTAPWEWDRVLANYRPGGKFK